MTTRKTNTISNAVRRSIFFGAASRSNIWYLCEFMNTPKGRKIEEACLKNSFTDRTFDEHEFFSTRLALRAHGSFVRAVRFQQAISDQ